MSMDENVTSRAEISAQSAQSFAEAQESKSDRDYNVTSVTLVLSSVEESRQLDFPSLILLIFQSPCFIIRK